VGTAGCRSRRSKFRKRNTKKNPKENQKKNPKENQKKNPNENQNKTKTEPSKRKGNPPGPLRSVSAKMWPSRGLIVGGLLLVLYLFSGVWPPMVVIESSSMMHGEDSQVGVIDTGRPHTGPEGGRPLRYCYLR